jgi:hypothetical protein
VQINPGHPTRSLRIKLQRILKRLLGARPRMHHFSSAIVVHRRLSRYCVARLPVVVWESTTDSQIEMAISERQRPRLARASSVEALLGLPWERGVAGGLSSGLTGALVSRHRRGTGRICANGAGGRGVTPALLGGDGDTRSTFSRLVLSNPLPLGRDLQRAAGDRGHLTRVSRSRTRSPRWSDCRSLPWPESPI